MPVTLAHGSDTVSPLSRTMGEETNIWDKVEQK